MGVRQQEQHDYFIGVSFVISIVVMSILCEYLLFEKLVKPKLPANILAPISFVQLPQTDQSQH